MAQKKRGRPRSLALEVERKLRELIDPTRGGASSAAQVYRELVKAAKAPKAKFREGDLPSQRTILNYFNELVVRDDSGVWSLLDPHERPDLLLRMLRHIPPHSLTRAEAVWIGRIVKAVPDIEQAPGALFVISREYVRAERAGGGVAHLDFSLSMAPTAQEAAGQLSEPDREALRGRIARHIEAHALEWPAEPLTMWTRADWIADLYMKEAEKRDGYMVVWDDREDVHFLQLKGL